MCLFIFPEERTRAAVQLVLNMAEAGTQHGLSTGRVINYKLPSYHENSFKISFETHFTY
jgi:hypothetical protein